MRMMQMYDFEKESDQLFFGMVYTFCYILAGIFSLWALFVLMRYNIEVSLSLFGCGIVVLVGSIIWRCIQYKIHFKE